MFCKIRQRSLTSAIMALTLKFFACFGFNFHLFIQPNAKTFSFYFPFVLNVFSNFILFLHITICTHLSGRKK